MAGIDKSIIFIRGMEDGLSAYCRAALISGQEVGKELVN
jgi:hypothetical protein